MKIYIKKTKDQTDELFLIELQGELSCRHDFSQEFSMNNTFNTLKMGILFDKFNRPHLRIGNHLLDGKRLELKEPLIVTLPSSKYNASTSQDIENPKLHIVGVIKEKIFFSKTTTCCFKKYTKKLKKIMKQMYYFHHKKKNLKNKYFI